MKKSIILNNKIMLGKKIFLRLLLIAITFFYASNSYANFNKIYEQNKVQLQQVEKYLNNIINFSAKFVQTSGKENLTKGRFLLARPGKMRIDYFSENPILIIVNGDVLSYKDLDLDETSYLKTSSTPASFLTRENISFLAEDTELTKVLSTNKEVRISLIKKGHKDAGEFTMIFEKSPLKFSKMEVRSDLDQITTISLQDIDFNSKLNRDLFENKVPQNSK